jgi:hypothetical protein
MVPGAAAGEVVQRGLHVVRMSSLVLLAPLGDAGARAGWGGPAPAACLPTSEINKETAKIECAAVLLLFLGSFQ